MKNSWTRLVVFALCACLLSVGLILAFLPSGSGYGRGDGNDNTDISTVFASDPYYWLQYQGPGTNAAANSGRISFGEWGDTQNTQQELAILGQVSTLTMVSGEPTMSSAVSRPMFSDAEMGRIIAGRTNTSNRWCPVEEREVHIPVDFGVITLNDAVANDFVAIELLNLRAPITNAIRMEFTYDTGNVNAVGDPIYNTQLHTRDVDPTDPDQFGFQHHPFLGHNVNANPSDRVDHENDRLRGRALQSAMTGSNQLFFNNNFSLVGFFRAEGLYQFSIRTTGWGGAVGSQMVFNFAFYIVHASHYQNDPRIAQHIINSGINPTQNQPVIYRGNRGDLFYNFAGRFPYTRFDPRRFDVNVIGNNFRGEGVHQPIITPDGDTGFSIMEFQRLGRYTVNARKIFRFQGEDVPITSYTGMTYRLTIFGYQAYYEEFTQTETGWESQPTWFGGGGVDHENNATNSDMSRRFHAHPIATTLAAANSFQTTLQNQVDAWRTSPIYIDNPFTPRPVVTNQAPVQIFGNGVWSMRDEQVYMDGVGFVTRNSHMSRVSFMPAGSNTWTNIPFQPNVPLRGTGTYLITLYYHFDVATDGARGALPFRQVLYFQIIDIMDVRVREADGSMDNIMYLGNRQFATTTPFVFYWEGAGFFEQPSPYSQPPRIELSITDFNGVPRLHDGLPIIYHDFPLCIVAQRDIIAGFMERVYDDDGVNYQYVSRFGHGDGVYHFRIFYGAVHQASAQFSVIVDRSVVMDWQLREWTGESSSRALSHNEPTFAQLTGSLPDNFAMISGGGAGLRWSPKDSGITFTSAEVEFFAFNHRGGAFEISEHTHSTVNPHPQRHLASPYEIRLPAGVPNNRGSITPARVVAEQSGGSTVSYRLDREFTAQGIYIVRVSDLAGNESTFVLVIDNTTAAFSQTPRSDPNLNINMVSANQVTVGFGAYKAIQMELAFDLQTIFGDVYLNPHTDMSDNPAEDMSFYRRLRESAVMVTGQQGLVVPISRVEMAFNETRNNAFNDVFRGTSANQNQHWHTINNTNNQAEGFYTFRTWDALDNVSYHYVYVNNDPARGLVFEHGLPQFAPPTDTQGNNWDPDAGIVRRGGVANSDYLTFAFWQRPTQYVVGRVDLRFYPKNTNENNRFVQVWNAAAGEYRTEPNTNFPFVPTSQAIVRNNIYTQGDFGTTEGWRYLNINRQLLGQTTEGIYVISRHFASRPTGSPAPIIRNHYFVVDRNPVIAPNFQTEIEIAFGDGAKTAGWTHFQHWDNAHLDPDSVEPNTILQTNTSARVSVPLTKYSQTVMWQGSPVELGTSSLRITMPGVNPVTTPTRFTGLELTLDFEHRVGGNWDTGQSFNHSNPPPTMFPSTNTGMHRLIFMDGSGGLSWQLGNVQPTTPNRSEILLEIVGGASGAFYRNNQRIITNSTQFDMAESLTFRYIVEDTHSFFVDVDRTEVEILRFNGDPDDPDTPNFQTPGNFVREYSGTTVFHEYIIRNALNVQSVGSDTRSGDTIIVRLFGDIQYAPGASGVRPYVEIELTIDNARPNHNFTRVGQTDTLWGLGAFNPAVTPGRLDAHRFFYSIPHDFEFELCDDSRHARHDTHRISFFEVNSNFSPRYGEMPFDYEVPFYQVLEGSAARNLSPGDNRYFRIVEWDEAGNYVIYYVQTRYPTYLDTILATNIETPHGAQNLLHDSGAVFGMDITITNAVQFWNDNPHFELRAGNQVFQRFGRFARTGNSPIAGGLLVGTVWYSENATPIDLARELNSWLRAAATAQVELPLYINNGFRHGNNDAMRRVSIFQSSHALPQNHHPRLRAFAIGNNVQVELANEPLELPTFHSRPELDGFWTMDVFDLSEPINTNNPAWASLPFEERFELYNYPLEGNQFSGVFGHRVIMGGAESELLFVLRNQLGQVTATEFNPCGGYFDFDWTGRTVAILDGVEVPLNTLNSVIHTGAGVNVTLTYGVHELEIRRDGLRQSNPTPAPDGILRNFHIAPPVNSISTFNVRIISTGSREVLINQTFVFYTNLPQLRFTNLSGGDIGNQIILGDINGIVQVSFDRIESIFESTVSWTREFPNPRFDETQEPSEANPLTVTDAFTVRRGATRFNLTQPGTYTVQVMNSVWAVQSYTFSILDVDNVTYHVYFNNLITPAVGDEPAEFERVKLRPSPVPFTTNLIVGLSNQHQIPHYFVRGVAADITSVRGFGGNTDSPLEIVPSINFPRTLGNIYNNAAWNVTTPTHTYSTRVYRLIPLIGEGSSLFIAVTAISINVYNPTTGELGGFGLNVAPTSALLDRREGFFEMFTIEEMEAAGSSVITVQLTGTQPHNVHEGNILFVDYYHNGRFAGTFRHGEVLEISERDYGVFTFYLRDWAGHQRVFAHAGDSSTHFTLVNLTRPPILINGFEVIDGMVYNDEINMLVMPIPLTTRPLSGFMYISRIQVWRNGVYLPYESFTFEERHEDYMFQWTTPGAYRFRVEYIYQTEGPLGARPTVVEFSAQIVPSFDFIESLYFGAPTNMEIVGVTLNGNRHQSMRDTDRLTSISLDAGTGIGHYVVTTRILADNIRGEQIRTFRVPIRPMFDVEVISASVAWGGSAGSVAVNIDTTLISILFNGASLVITRDGEELNLDELTTGRLTTAPINAPSAGGGGFVQMTFSENGNYLIVLTCGSGAIITSNGFGVGGGVGGMTIVIIIGVIGGVIALAVVFWLLRTRMKVK